MSNYKITMKSIESIIEKEPSVSDEYKYLGVMYEDRYKSTPDNPKFYGKSYLYKTQQNLKEGQVITLNNSRVVVNRWDISKEDAEKEAAQCGYTLEALKEI